MKREELLISPDYWVAKAQTDLFNQVNDYLKESKISRNDLAKSLGVTKGYISQVLNGNCDHRLSKIVELSMAIGKVPTIIFQDLQTILDDDKNDLIHVKVDYTVTNNQLDYCNESPVYRMNAKSDVEEYLLNGSLKTESNGR